jgi:hypothetical protein
VEESEVISNTFLCEICGSHSSDYKDIVPCSHYSKGTLLHSYQNTWHHIPGDSNIFLLLPSTGILHQLKCQVFMYPWIPFISRLSTVVSVFYICGFQFEHTWGKSGFFNKRSSFTRGRAVMAFRTTFLASCFRSLMGLWGNQVSLLSNSAVCVAWLLKPSCICTGQHFFICIKEVALCIIYQNTSVLKEYNIKRYTKQKHVW